MFSPDVVANEFLDIAKKEGEKINFQKLMYLVYLSHGWHLALYDSPLISHPICAGKYGIMITSIYRKLVSKFGNEPIYSMCANVYFDDHGKLSFFFPRLTDESEIKAEIEIASDLIRHCWGIYKKFDAKQLSNYANQIGSPFRVIYDVMKENIPEGTWIPNGAIKKYFLKLLDESRSAENTTKEEPVVTELVGT